MLYFHPMACLLVVLVVVRGADLNQTDGGPRGCCPPKQVSGFGQVKVGSDIVDEFEFYADYDILRALNIGKEYVSLFHQDTQTVFTFTEIGCQKMKFPWEVDPCIQENESIKFVTRYQAKALDGKGWRWISKWKGHTETRPDKIDKADPTKKALKTVYMDEANCVNEKTVTEYPDGTTDTHLMWGTRPVVDEPTIFDLDTSECVWADGMDTSKAEL